MFECRALCVCVCVCPVWRTTELRLAEDDAKGSVFTSPGLSVADRDPLMPKDSTSKNAFGMLNQRSKWINHKRQNIHTLQKSFIFQHICASYLFLQSARVYAHGPLNAETRICSTRRRTSGPDPVCVACGKAQILMRCEDKNVAWSATGCCKNPADWLTSYMDVGSWWINNGVLTCPLRTDDF